MQKLLAAAFLMTVTVCSSAFALPAASPSDTLRVIGSDLVQQTQAYHRRDRSRVHRPARRYSPGSHLRTPPRGWHRHHVRPRDWRTRGCVAVGPLWFCP